MKKLETTIINFKDMKISVGRKLEIINLFDAPYLYIYLNAIKKDHQILKILRKKKNFYKEYNQKKISEYVDCSIIIKKEQTDVLTEILSLDQDLYLIGINDIHKVNEEIIEKKDVKKLWKSKNKIFSIVFTSDENSVEITVNKSKIDINLNKLVKQIKKNSENPKKVIRKYTIRSFLILLPSYLILFFVMINCLLLISSSLLSNLMIFLIGVFFPLVIILFPTISKRFFMLSEIRMVLCTYGVLILYLIAIFFSYMEASEFSYSKWNNKNYCDRRYSMVYNIDKEQFIGKDKKLVYDKLGNTCVFEDKEKICYRVDSYMIYNYFLCFHFDENNKVTKYNEPSW